MYCSTNLNQVFCKTYCELIHQYNIKHCGMPNVKVKANIVASCPYAQSDTFHFKYVIIKV